MRYRGLLRTAPFLLMAALALSACKSNEEKAEEYFQSALELADEGDYDRAIIELRNVFEFDSSHREARFTLATIQLEQKDNLGAAYRQFLRLVEQYPDDLETRIILAELAFQIRNWEELVRHGTRAVELDAENPRVRAIAVALDYRQAVLDDDAARIREMGRESEALLVTQPESTMLQSLLLDVNLRNGAYPEALEIIDWLLERDPDNMLVWRQRLGILAQTNDMEALEAQLLDMTERFPDDMETRGSLLRFYMSREETDKAEDFLRRRVAEASPEDNGPRGELITFLMQVRGADAAREAIDAAIAEAVNPVDFRIIRAGLDYSQGDRDAGVAELEAILKNTELAPETSHQVKINLARMLLGMNNEVAARARVEEVLAEDDSYPDAIKMQARWQIQADEADEAINNLRLALDRAPEDAGAMTLMAQAYVRTGRQDLAKEFLALAVDASGNAPEESLRYARVLISEERYLPAEDILLPALRLAPRNPDLLITLGNLYLRMDDLPRAEQVLNSLKQIETPEAQRQAISFEAEIINRRNGVEEALGYLESIAQSDDATLANRTELVRARLATGEVAAALSLAQDLVEENPDNPGLKAMLATTQAANGDTDAAIDGFRAVLDAEPSSAKTWLELARLTAIRDGAAAGRAVVGEALATLPDNPSLLWAEASYRERSGDIDGAIGIYEDLYTRNSGSVIVANNLASLLTTYRDDAESLNRAWTVARRFRDTQIPAMQDTYGWILHRRGESEEALPYLEQAAAGLPNDPIVQYHLGKVYEALERPEDALAQFRTAVQIAGDSDERAQIVEARARVNASTADSSEGAKN